MVDNLFDDAHVGDTERFEPLHDGGAVLIERISGAPVTPGEYTQAWDEWVALLRGTAALTLHGRTHQLRPGDHLTISAGTRHVVEHASQDAVWLAVHINRPLEAQTHSG